VVAKNNGAQAGDEEFAPGFGLAVLEAVLERITYANEDNGYTVARVDTGRGDDLLTVVGALFGAQPGESLRMRGRWGSHPQYGRQFHVENYTTVLPATIQGIQRYLGSGLIKGIGPKTAEKIVGHFGTETLEVIENAPDRLIEVPSLGPKRTKLIAAAWIEQKAIKEVMVFLQSVGVTTSISVRIYKEYGDNAIEIVKSEPYKLAGEVWGIGFKTADAIAVAVGIPHDSPERVKAGLQYALSQATDAGNCFLPREKLLAEAVKILQVGEELCAKCLEELVEAEGAVREVLPGEFAQTEALYLVPFHRAESALSRQLLDLLKTSEDRLAAFQSVDWAKALAGCAAHRQRARARAGAGGQARADPEGRGAHRRPRLRQELHRPLGGGAARRRRGEGGARRADRPRRQAPGRADRRRGRHRAPAAGAQARRRRGLRPGPPAGRRPRGRRRGLDARRPAGEQAGQGGRPGRPPAPGGRRGPAPSASARARSCGTS
jgi:Holliday junction resolvasome RuvABC DNA-binding subunit